MLSFLHASVALYHKVNISQGLLTSSATAIIRHTLLTLLFHFLFLLFFSFFSLLFNPSTNSTGQETTQCAQLAHKVFTEKSKKLKKRTRDKIYNHGEVNAATDAGHILINSQTSYETDDPRSLLFVLLLLLFLFLSWSPDDHPKSRRGEWVWVRDPRRDRLHGELLFSTIASRPPTNPTYILLYLLQVLTLPTPMSQVQKRR